MAAAAAAAPRICFNSRCKEPRPESAPRRKGWRLRSGELAELCDRCCDTYDQGTFCETFHSNDGGWRNCELCGKRVHCGCIVSNHAYLLLDAGGVECIICARKSMMLAPNQMRPSCSFLPLQTTEWPKDLPAKSRNPMTGSYPGHWRQVPKKWNLSSTQTELQRRISYEFDRPSCNEKLIPGGRPPISVPEKKIEDLSDKIPFSGLGHHVARDRYANGDIAVDTVPAFNMHHQDDGNANGMQNSGHNLGETDSLSARKEVMSALNPAVVNLEGHPSSSQSSSPLIGLAAPYPLACDSTDQCRVLANQQYSQMVGQSMGKQQYLNHHTVNDSTGELQAMRSGKHRVEGRGRNHLLSRYCPRITSEELQQISGNSNSVVIPLFEKILSASDAGRIGRLVLPKKCAEAYFPLISQPEGLPLKVQDATGKEWVFQFRFWPNNNSRMYVLEGVTPCIQAMQLLAGDTVTFSRIDPEGKLVMGFRKASSMSAEQDNQTSRTCGNFSAPSEANNRNGNLTESTANATLRHPKSSTELRNSRNTEDPNVDKTGIIQNDGPGSKALPGSTKRKSSAFGSKNKRLRIDNEDSIELKFTWEEAQELLRPPPNHSSNVVVIDGHEIEEYEEAPVIGKPTLFATDQAGEKHQWAQCENCSKWRKLPVDALLPFRWICADNIWDRERTSCTTPQEISKEQLASMLPATVGASKKLKPKVENDSVEVSDGLDTLANLAILGEGEALPSSQATTKHPRHRPGCTCIVCIQPPSGKGPKHHQTCQCNVCLTVKRRFRTLMLRREKRQSGNEVEKKQQLIQSSGTSLHQRADRPLPANNVIVGSTQEKMVYDDDFVDEESECKTPPTLSPLKAKIDLNIQPERDEELSHPRDLTDTPDHQVWLPGVRTEDMPTK